MKSQITHIKVRILQVYSLHNLVFDTVVVGLFHGFVVLPEVLHELVVLERVEQSGAHADAARRVQDVNHRAAVGRLNLDGGVGAGSGGATWRRRGHGRRWCGHLGEGRLLGEVKVIEGMKATGGGGGASG